MKLSQCKLGEIVRTNDDVRRVGHITGLTYNLSLKTILSYGSESNPEIIPLVLFVGEQIPTPVNHCNLKIYKD